MAVEPYHRYLNETGRANISDDFELKTPFNLHGLYIGLYDRVVSDKAR